MNDLWIPLAFFLGCSVLAVGLFIAALAIERGLAALAVKLEKAVTVTVSQPAITVQAPTALLPERVQQTLDAIDAKLQPPKPVVTDEQLATLVHEAVVVAETSTLKGYAKFRFAKGYISTRFAAFGAELPSERDLALRIEAEVVKLREGR